VFSSSDEQEGPRLQHARAVPFGNMSDKCRRAGYAPPIDVRATKKERSGLQAACDELIDKGAIITGE
jgi:hypothetical protein